MHRLSAVLVVAVATACARSSEPPRSEQAPLAAALPPGPASVDQGWWARARSAILADEFRPREVAPGSFRLAGPTGHADLTDSAFAVTGWRWRTLEVGPVAPAAEGARVVYDRGGVKEWYEASPRGIEQGFTFARPPSRGDLVVRGRVESELAPRSIEGGFAFGDLRYTDLVVRDAAGRTLAATMRWDDRAQAIELRVPRAALAGATFPVVVDPLLSSASTIVDPTNQGGSQFGLKLASAGDVNGDGFADVVVGAPRFTDSLSLYTQEGRVYVFFGGASGMSDTPGWTKDDCNQTDCAFGSSVAGVGDVNGDGFGDLLVGGNLFDSPGYTNEGRAWLYLGTDAGPEATASWVLDPTNQASNAQYGGSVAGAGDVNGDGYADVLVAAPGRQISTRRNEGTVYLYLGSETGLATSPATTLIAPGQTTQVDSYFGVVAAAGDVNGDGYGDVIVGAPRWGDPDATPSTVLQGRVYVFHGTSTGLDTAAANVLTNCPDSNCYYGGSVAGAGDVNGDGYADVIIGADRWSDAAGGFAADGAAFIHYGSAAGLSDQPDWTAAPTDQSSSWFGSAVAGAGDVNGDGYADVLVGAGYFDEPSLTNAGRAYLFTGGPNGPAVTPAWSASPTARDESLFGGAASGAGDANADGFGDVIVGANNWRPTAAYSGYEGRAYFYKGSAIGLETDAAWLVDPADQDLAAVRAAGAGDVDGDGAVDVVVGAPGMNGQSDGEGMVFLVPGPGMTPTSTVDPANEVNAHFGASLVVADFNADGFADVLAAAPDAASGAGRAWLFLGGVTGLPATAAWTASPAGQAGAHFGKTIAVAGDVDGDGFLDAVISAPDWDDTAAARTDEGRVYLYFGGPGGLSPKPVRVLDAADQAGAHFGAALAGNFDTDGDGLADVAVGAPDWDDLDASRADEGRAYLFLGSDIGLQPTPAWTVDSADQASASFGLALAAGDFDRDGLDDLAVGAPGVNVSALARAGKVFVFRGVGGGFEATPGWSASPAALASAAFGGALAALDANGDGFADLAASAPGLQITGPAEGRTYLFAGSPTLFASTPSWTANPSDQSLAQFGDGLVAVEVDGDGFADLLASASGWGLPDREGRVWLYHGGDGARGMSRGLAQFQSNGTTPIRRGAWVAAGPVVLSARATQEGPAGALMTVEFEIKALGTRFDGTQTVLSTPVKGGANATASATVGQGRYHWRARVVYPVGTGFGRWISFGGNAETEPDLVVGSANGAACSGNASCASGFCVDSVCCNTACGAGATDCQACSVAKGGAVDGHCLPFPNNTVCRASRAACDSAETCDGMSGTCPDDALAPQGSVCRAATLPCDGVEVCDGQAETCPADIASPAGTVCRASGGDCDVEEVCNGTAKTCPTDVLVPNLTTCRPSLGVCDPAESCNGVLAVCPNDVVAANNSSCSDGLTCNGAETCFSGECQAATAPNCDDSNPCTDDSCEEPAGCRHVAVAGCCRFASECNDSDPCTADTCTDNACVHTATPCTPDGGTADAAAPDAARPDAGARDAGPAPVDAAAPLDAAATEPDAATPDAAAQGDSGAATGDASAKTDGALATGDGGTAASDGGAPSNRDAGAPADVPQGCGCGAGGALASPLWALCLLALAARRRRR